MKKRNVIALGILALVVLILLAYQTPIMEQARGLAWNAWVHSIGRLFDIDPTDSSNSVQDQLRALQIENIRLHTELRDYTRLKTQLGTPSFASLRSIPSAIVGRPIDTFQSQFIINKGIQDGITLGAPAVIGGSTLVGTVTHITTSSATIQSLYHPDSEFTAEVRSEDEEVPPARGLLTSKYYTTLQVTKIPRDIPITEGQQAVTTSHDEHIPAGLFLGTVEAVGANEHAAYQDITLSVPYDVDTIDAVQILVLP